MVEKKVGGSKKDSYLGYVALGSVSVYAGCVCVQ